MPRTGSFADMMSLQWTDLTDNGKCIGCGECCSNILPMSDEDVRRIRKYIKQHNIKPITHIALLADIQLDMECPFCDLTQEKKCTIYEVRPEICRLFICSKKRGDVADLLSNPKMQNCTVRFVRQTFFGE